MILLVDNYDSFTYNLAHQFAGTALKIMRNDDSELLKAAAEADAVVFSPGPGRPAEAGQMEAVIAKLKGRIPMLGICLGHQALGEVFGAEVITAPEIRHGKISVLTHQGSGLFNNCQPETPIMRYHSLMLDPTTLPLELEVTGTCDGVVMGIKHRDYPLYGLQFHPESIGTKEGQQMIDNFLQVVSASREKREKKVQL